MLCKEDEECSQAGLVGMDHFLDALHSLWSLMQCSTSQVTQHTCTHIACPVSAHELVRQVLCEEKQERSQAGVVAVGHFLDALLLANSAQHEYAAKHGFLEGDHPMADADPAKPEVGYCQWSLAGCAVFEC